jgi:hypothetical protein
MTAMRKKFEEQDVSGHPDYTYSIAARRYVCNFTQGRWLNWQTAWVAGKNYKPGQDRQETPARIVQSTAPPPAATTTANPARLTRTRPA